MHPLEDGLHLGNTRFKPEGAGVSQSMPLNYILSPAPPRGRLLNLQIPELNHWVEKSAWPIKWNAKLNTVVGLCSPPPPPPGMCTTVLKYAM